MLYCVTWGVGGLSMASLVVNSTDLSMCIVLCSLGDYMSHDLPPCSIIMSPPRRFTAFVRREVDEQGISHIQTALSQCSSREVKGERNTACSAHTIGKVRETRPTLLT